MAVRTREFILRSALVLVTAVFVAPALALHEESPPATRLTSGDSHQHPYGRAWGNWFAFSSTQDLLNIGAARAPGKQIFVFNMNYYDCFNGTTKTCAPGAPPGSCQQTPCPPPGTPYLRQVTKIGECLIVQIARDATSLTFRFVREVEARVCELAVGVDECGARGHDSSTFKYGPQERQECEREQDGERG